MNEPSALNTLTAGIAASELETGNVLPILHEVAHALRRWVESGEATSIDLRRVPLTAKEEALIEAHLGRGEVSARLDALGRSEFTETSHAGVWLTVHSGPDGTVQGKWIEVTSIPAMLASQPEDVSEGLERLDAILANWAGDDGNGEEDRR